MKDIQSYVVIAIILLIAYFVSKRLGSVLKTHRSPLITVEAKISDKRIEMMSDWRRGSDKSHQKEAYYLSFLLSDGSSLEFFVRKEDFYDFEIGTKGKVSYQGTRYQGFESDGN